MRDVVKSIYTQILVVFLVIVSTLALFRNADAENGPPAHTTFVSEGNNRLAIDLYANLAKSDGNLFMSPYSVSVSLAMTYTGARGNTAAEMREVMYVTVDDDQLLTGFEWIINNTNRRGSAGDFRLAVANSLWGQIGVDFTDEFLGDNQRYYGSEIQQVDFASDPETARMIINKWVEEQTENRIRDLIYEGLLTPTTRLVLANAIYFKGVWQYQFVEDDTKEGNFTLSDGVQISVPLMQQVETFGYYEQDGFQALSMRYLRSRLRMAVFLPRKTGGIKNFEQSITYDNLDLWLRSLESSLERVDVTFPRFKVADSFSLSQTLQSLGMADAFDETQADFSGMTGNRNFCVDEIVHKTFIDVDEVGTEAAASTAAAIKMTMAPNETGEPVVFRADHPFFFVIEDPETKTVLFMGRVSNPGS
jgi:serpin B